MAKAKYCCFVCPDKNWDVKDSSTPCPVCGRPYGFPLDAAPTVIGKYQIESPRGRGFYAAAYLAVSGRLKAKSVLKVSPVDLYKFFGKDFYEESDLHAQLAQGANHIVGIRDAFEETVTFGNGVTLPCYVCELEFLDGNLLTDYIDGTLDADAATVAQIAIDLLRMRKEFEQKRLHHNDLHADNVMVERLPANMRRQDAINDSILVKAIDLGSLADASKSGLQDRFGDLASIGRHLHALVGRLLSKPQQIEDRDYRVALALQTIAQGLVGFPENARVPNVADLVGQIQEAYYQATQPWRPWAMPLSLKSYGDHYNALTLNSWNVPSLLVDPDGSWLQEVSKAGPQIIIGMRGCGKTMLLRALDFHARANPQPSSETPERIVTRLKADKYVGLFVPAQRLLDLKEQSLNTPEQRIAVLFVYFALQAVRAVIHLADLDPKQVAANAHGLLEEAAFDFLKGTEGLRGAASIGDLERRLERLAVTTSRQDNTVEIASAPAQVFTRLAENLRRCSPLWLDSQVFYLLDDVSTRYLALDKIERIFSALLFSNPVCAFKFTSEWQTLELGLRSPGRVNPIQIDRDVSVFDLGSVVHKTVKSRGKGKGKNFVEKILEQRAAHFPRHPPKVKPSQLLGDVNLETVASEIAGSGETSSARKRVYRGLTCLANVCVGDIGDIIKLYEEILRAWDGNKAPISDEVQSQCFQDISSLRLYDLNRRRVPLMKSAKAFAEASYELLVLSGKESAQGKESRLRQYSSVYVRVTSETPPTVGASESKLDPSTQIDRLRELIDAGVFVFSGGNPRTKTKDSNPIQQFKLSYRKIYGLANFIGLADRDRFELSGADLGEWLTNPESSKDILLRNQKGAIEDESQDDDVDEASTSSDAELSVTQGLPEPQQDLFAGVLPQPESSPASDPPGLPVRIEVDSLSKSDFAGRKFDTIITGLGFEARTLASNRHLASLCVPKRVVGVAYEKVGYRDEIIEVWKGSGLEIEQVAYSDCIYRIPDLGDNALIDVSGLAKPVIFHAVREQLMRSGRVVICHAAARKYYPLQSDLDAMFSAEAGQNKLEMLAGLAKVLKGEKGPYEPRRLLAEQGDALRKRVLLGYVSPKHERIFELLEMREYDGIELVCGAGEDARSRVARLAGEVLIRNHSNARLVPIDSNDLVKLVGHADDTFRALYGSAGAAFEIALTGSKLQAVAAAVISARRRVAQAWYVSPQTFDEKRFSTGVGAIRFYEIRLP